MPNLTEANRLLCDAIGEPALSRTQFHELYDPDGDGLCCRNCGESTNSWLGPCSNVPVVYPALYANWAGAGKVIEAMREKYNLTIIIDAKIGRPCWVRLHQPADHSRKQPDGSIRVEREETYRGSAEHTELPMAAFLAACAALGITIGAALSRRKGAEE